MRASATGLPLLLRLVKLTTSSSSSSCDSSQARLVCAEDLRETTSSSPPALFDCWSLAAEVPLLLGAEPAGWEASVSPLPEPSSRWIIALGSRLTRVPPLLRFAGLGCSEVPFLGATVVALPSMAVALLAV